MHAIGNWDKEERNIGTVNFDIKDFSWKRESQGAVWCSNNKEWRDIKRKRGSFKEDIIFGEK